MVKFKVLKYNEFILIHLGMFSNRYPEKSSDDFFNSLKTCFILFISGSFSIGAAMFAYQHSAEFTLALRTWSFTLGASHALVLFICFRLNAYKIQTVHHKLQELVDKLTAEESTMTQF